MLGAAILAARAGLRGGAGLVRVALPAASRDAFTVACPAATTLARDELAVDVLLEGARAVVAGPGLGTDQQAGELLGVLRAACRVPLLLDADALNLVAPLPDDAVAQLGNVDDLVITPHPGEAARLLGRTSAEIQADREQSVADLAARSGGIAVLKGAGTLVCDGARLYHNHTGNPGLGTGGSGDVLAGLIGALLAQGMTPFDAAVLGVQVHGRAGDRVAERIGERGLCAEDLPLAIAEELRG